MGIAWVMPRREIDLLASWKGLPSKHFTDCHNLEDGSDLFIVVSLEGEERAKLKGS